MKRLLLALALLFVATSVHAQPVDFDHYVNYLPTAGERRAADIASTVGVAASIGIDTWNAWDAPNRKRALAMEGVRLGATWGLATLAKKLVFRERPCAWMSLPEKCAPDQPNASFFSLHTAFAFSATPHIKPGFLLGISLTNEGTVGLERILAGKHWLSDVLVGAGVGIGTSFIR